MQQFVKLIVSCVLLPTLLWAQQPNHSALQGERSPEMIGTVLRPDGTPAEEAEIAVGSKGNSIYANNGQFDRIRTPVIVKADASGKFSFPRIDGQYSLVVLEESGWAILRQEDFERTKTVQLRLFHEIEGKTIAIPNQKRPARMDCYLDSFSFGKGGREKLEGYVIIMTIQTEIQADGTYKFTRYFFNPEKWEIQYPHYYFDFHYSEPITIYQDEKQELVYPSFYEHIDDDTRNRKEIPLQGKAIIPEEWKETVKTSIAYLYFEPDNSHPRFFERTRQRSNDRQTVPDLTTPPVRVPRLVDLRQDPYEYTRVVSEEIEWGRANIASSHFRFRKETVVAPLDHEGNFQWDSRMEKSDVFLFLRPNVLLQEGVEDKWVAKCYYGWSIWDFHETPSDRQLHNPPGGVVYLLTEKTIKEPLLPKKITLHLIDENGNPVSNAIATAQFDGGTIPRAVSDKNGCLEFVFSENMRGGVKTFCTIKIFSRQQGYQNADIRWERKRGRWEYIPEQLTVVLSRVP